MPTPDRTSPLHFRLWTVFALVVFVAYVGGALLNPDYSVAMALTILLILLLGSSVVVAITSRGATRVFWAAFAFFGFTQCLHVRKLIGMMRGHFPYRLLREHDRVAFDSVDDRVAFDSVVTIAVIIVIASAAAYICRAVYVLLRRAN